jgi:hypothetical protein
LLVPFSPIAGVSLVGAFAPFFGNGLYYTASTSWKSWGEPMSGGDGSQGHHQQETLTRLARKHGGRVGARAGALGALTAALLFGAFGTWGSSPRQGFWHEMAGAVLCFGVPLSSFGGVLGWVAGTAGGLAGGICVRRSWLGRGAPLLGAVVGILVALGVVRLLVPVRLLAWQYDWFLYLAAAAIPAGGGVGGWAGTRRAVRALAINTQQPK